MLKLARKGFTLVELLVVIVIIAVLIGLLLPAITKALRRAKVANCSNNLSQMWKMAYIYQAQFGGRSKTMNSLPGGQFWRALEKTNPPLIMISNIDIFLCPVKGEGNPGDLQYYGPCVSVNKISDGGPIACDDIAAQNHGEEGVNMLRKSGDVQELTPDDLAAIPATFTGQDGLPVQ